MIDGRPVTSASSFGRLVTDIDLTLDRRTKDIENVRADNVIVTRDVRALDVQALIDRYTLLVAPVRDRAIGNLTAPLLRAADNSGESTAGNVVADAQLNDTLTGAQLYEMLKQQWCGLNSTRILLPSHTVHYTFDTTKVAVGAACATAQKLVVPGSLTINGTQVVDSGSYRITVNSFLADGGDGFSVLPQGADRVGGAVDVDALERYFATAPQLSPPAQNRIDVVP